jgi:hypothetical protein
MRYTLDLEDKDAQTVLNGLAEMPYKLTYELINNIIGQIQAQQQAPQEKTEPPPV